MTPPLVGVKVLDFTQAAGGPFGAQLLGDMGADVIKIEPLSGDHFRAVMNGSWTFAVNRDKRGLAVDLRTVEGRDIALKLVEGADVLFEAFVPGTMDKLGLGYDAVHALNPRLIYCSLSAYGQSGPYRERGGYDVCAQAESGLMTTIGVEDGPYMRIGASMMDYGTGMYAALGIVLALLAREKTNRGQRVGVSLFESAVSWMNNWVAHYSMSGENPPRMGSGHLVAVPYQVFDSKDKPLFIGISKETFWHTFCDVLGLQHLANDPRYATMAKRMENRQELLAIVQSELLRHTRDELCAKLIAAGIPCAPVNTVGEMMDDVHVKDQGLLVDMDVHGLKMKVPGIPIRLSDTPGEIRRPGVLLGEDTVAILAELGFDKERIDELIEKRVVKQATV